MRAIFDLRYFLLSLLGGPLAQLTAAVLAVRVRVSCTSKVKFSFFVFSVHAIFSALQVHSTQQLLYEYSCCCVAVCRFHVNGAGIEYIKNNRLLEHTKSGMLFVRVCIDIIVLQNQ